MLLVLPVMGTLLFDARVVATGLLTGGVGLALGVVLPALGLARYAPFLAHAPFDDGRLDPAWIFSQGVPSFFAMATGLGIFLTLMTRLRERQRQLEILSSTDTLTGLANRRVFFERLEEERARAERHAHPLSVLMVDVDQFKAINDTHGHQVGDEVLRQLGVQVRSVVRLEDVAARLGGEELGVILPDTPLEGARVVARRLLEASRLVTLPGGAKVTVSVGVAERAKTEAGDALMTRADRALYAAKSTGRDREVAG
jgi:diguanylate cyclase (GGDEF)-like protein